MRTDKLFFMLIFPLTFLFLLPGLSVAKKTPKIEEYRVNVIQLSVKFSDGQKKYGFGFVVGERGNLLYAVTANHVVREMEVPDVRADEINVRFFTDQGKYYKANLLSISLKDLDVALLEIRKPYQSYKWQKFFHCPKVRKGEKVRFIGRNQGWWIPVNYCNVQEEAYRGKFLTSTRDVQPGTSGAPLISDKGIIGMLITDDDYDVETVDIGEIKTFVERKGYPWNIAECLKISIYPKKQRRGNDVKISFDKPTFDNPTRTGAAVKFRGRYLPKKSEANGQILRVTIPGDTDTGRWPFEVEWQGHTYESEPIEIYEVQQSKPKNSRRAPPSGVRREAPPAK